MRTALMVLIINVFIFISLSMFVYLWNDPPEKVITGNFSRNFAGEKKRCCYEKSVSAANLGWL
jgi:hypothetical protein